MYLEHSAEQGEQPANDESYHSAASHSDICGKRVGNIGDRWKDGVEHHVDGVTGRDTLNTSPDDRHDISVENWPVAV